MLIKGIKKVLDFTLKINEFTKSIGQGQRIHVFDIGGGLPVSYHKDLKPPLMEDYVLN